MISKMYVIPKRLAQKVSCKDLTANNPPREVEELLKAVPQLSKLPESIALWHRKKSFVNEAGQRCPPADIVHIYPYIAVPYFKHPGSPPKGIKLHSQLMHGGKGELRDVSTGLMVRTEQAPSNPDSPATYCANALAFLQVHCGTRRYDLAYVSWYKDVEEPSSLAVDLEMRELEPEELTHPKRDFTDLASLVAVVGPAYLQPHPSIENRFLYNPYVKFTE